MSLRVILPFILLLVNIAAIRINEAEIPNYRPNDVFSKADWVILTIAAVLWGPFLFLTLPWNLLSY